MKEKRFLFLFILILISVSSFSQRIEKEKVNLNSNKFLIKVDVLKSIITRPQVSVECFLSKQFSIESGVSLLNYVYGAHDENTGSSSYSITGLFIGPGKGHEVFGDIKYRLDKRHFYKNLRIYAGIGYAYRQVNYENKWLVYKTASHGQDRVLDRESQTAYINALRFTGGLFFGPRHSKHLCFNPYVAVMPGIVKYHLEIDSLQVYDHSGGFRNINNSNPHISKNKTANYIYFEIGFNICFGFGRNGKREEE